MRATGWALVSLAFLSHCKNSFDEAAQELHKAPVAPSVPFKPRLTIEPTRATIVQGESQRFTVMLQEDHNVRRDVTAKVKWDVSNASLGSIDRNGLMLTSAIGRGTLGVRYGNPILSSNAEFSVVCSDKVAGVPSETVLVKGDNRVGPAGPDFEDYVLRLTGDLYRNGTQLYAGSDHSLSIRYSINSAEPCSQTLMLQVLNCADQVMAEHPASGSGEKTFRVKAGQRFNVLGELTCGEKSHSISLVDPRSRAFQIR